MIHPRTSAALAWGLAGMGTVLSIVGIFFAYQYRSIALEDIYVTWQSGVIGLLPVLLTLFIGGLISARRPENHCGWVMLGFIFVHCIQTFVESLGIYGHYIAHWSDSLIVWFIGLVGLAWITSFALLALLFLLFPTGEFLSKRWRITGRVIVLALVVGTLGAMIMPGPMTMIAPIQNPLGVSGLGSIPIILLYVGVLLIFGMILLGVLSILLRFRKSVGDARQQIKWIAFGALVFGIFLVSDFFVELPGLWETVKESLAFAVMPLTIGLAILHYRLYDIDLLIRRTLQYTLLTGLLALVYFGSVILLQTLFENLTGAQSPLVIVLSTLALAALFNPLRHRVQDFIDQRFYRKKYDAEQALAQFASVARDEVDMDRLTTALLGVVEESIQPASVSLWLKPPYRNYEFLTKLKNIG